MTTVGGCSPDGSAAACGLSSCAEQLGVVLFTPITSLMRLEVDLNGVGLTCSCDLGTLFTAAPACSTNVTSSPVAALVRFTLVPAGLLMPSPPPPHPPLVPRATTTPAVAYSVLVDAALPYFSTPEAQQLLAAEGISALHAAQLAQWQASLATYHQVAPENVEVSVPAWPTLAELTGGGGRRLQAASSLQLDVTITPAAADAAAAAEVQSAISSMSIADLSTSLGSATTVLAVQAAPTVTVVVLDAPPAPSAPPPTPLPPEPSPPPPASEGNSLGTNLDENGMPLAQSSTDDDNSVVIAAAIGGAVVVLLLTALVCMCAANRRKEATGRANTVVATSVPVQSATVNIAAISATSATSTSSTSHPLNVTYTEGIEMEVHLDAPQEWEDKI